MLNTFARIFKSFVLLMFLIRVFSHFWGVIIRHTFIFLHISYTTLCNSDSMWHKQFYVTRKTCCLFRLASCQVLFAYVMYTRRLHNMIAPVKNAFVRNRYLSVVCTFFFATGFFVFHSTAECVCLFHIVILCYSNSEK